ncbi:MAG: helix-turn-helix domain-containing protein [Candidatus Rokubacteria bacterium]|nr:helix-turn-helix domain-containing protein [Candidatus Rokubacteria bacterium]
MRIARQVTTLAGLPELLTAEEAAGWLRVGRNTVYDMLRSGALRSVRLGRLIRVPREALEALGRSS